MLWKKKPFTLASGQSTTLKNIAGNILEMDLLIDPGEAKHFGVKVCCSKDGREQTPIIIDREKNTLQIDMKKSGLVKTDYPEYVIAYYSPDPNRNPIVETEEAPFSLKPGEKVRLRIFLDKSTLEVFANGRQCITQVIYPTLKDAVNVQVFHR